MAQITTLSPAGLPGRTYNFLAKPPAPVSTSTGIIKLSGEHRDLGFGDGGTVGLKRSREGGDLGFGVGGTVGLKRL